MDYKSVRLDFGVLPIHSPLCPIGPGRVSDSAEEDTLCDETGVDDLDHQSEMCSSGSGKQMQHTFCRAHMDSGRTQARLRT